MDEKMMSSSILFKNVLEKKRPMLAKTNGNRRLASLFDPELWNFERGLYLITLQLSDFHLNFSDIGLEAGMACLEICLDEAVSNFPAFFQDSRILQIMEPLPGECFLAFEHHGESPEAPFAAFLAYRASVARTVAARSQQLTGSSVDVQIGFAQLPFVSEEERDKSLAQAVCKAKNLALREIDRPGVACPVELRAVLAQGLSGVVYQPIADLNDGHIVGWEAMPRGLTGMPVQDALRLYSLTGSGQEALSMERDLWRLALAESGPIEPKQKLFLNASPAGLGNPAFTPRDLAAMVGEYGLDPANVVLEFPEKLSPGETSALLDRLESFRALGFMASVDHVGAGNANLMLLARFRPDFIKADASLMKGIESNPFKRVMLETLVLLAERTGVRVIADGVETELALSTLVSMGVHAGQGWFLSEPAFPKCTVPVNIPLKASFRSLGGEWKCSAPAGDLAKPCLMVDINDRVHDVKEMLADKPPMSSVVVVQAGRPMGLLMNYNLDKALSAKFGVDLYHHKQVAKLMDTGFLSIGANMPIEEAARLAMNREPGKIYDDIVVLRDGTLLGSISVQGMLDTLAKVQVELAKGSSPLTGLPGNVAIEREFGRRVREQLASSVVYVDLDNFKVYNDVYGFNQGDQAILLTARLLREALKDLGTPHDFLGHVGGDDFVVICDQDKAQAITDNVLAAFEQEAPKLYKPEDRERGHIQGKSREGQVKTFPIMTVSMGIVDCDFQVPVSYSELSHRMAEVKKFSKSQLGNSCVHDRRTPLGRA